jgi:hypothetical protein
LILLDTIALSEYSSLWLQLLALAFYSLLWAVFVLAVWAIIKRSFGQKLAPQGFQASQTSPAANTAAE